MHARQSTPPALQRLAELQSGVLSREQVLGHGLSTKVTARLIHSGAWQRLTDGLYLAHPLAPSWDALAWGGILLGGPHARLGGEASGYLTGLVPVAPEPVDVLVPIEKLVRNRDRWRFLRERPGVREARSFGSPPRLGTEDTLLDLADARPAAEVVGLVTRAVGSRLTTTARLERQLDRRSRHRHRDLLRDLLVDVAQGARSPLELKFLHDVERPHGLPRGDRQSSRTGLHYLCDVRYRRFALLVELDGKLGHEAEGRFRDMHRDNLHALGDEVTLRFGWYDVTTNPCAVAFQVFTVLSRRGFDLPFRRCPNCIRASELDLLGA